MAVNKISEEGEMVTMQGTVSRIQREYGFWLIVNNHTEYFFIPSDCAWGGMSFDLLSEGDAVSFSLRPKKKNAATNAIPDKETSVKRRVATNIVAIKNTTQDAQESIEEVKHSVTAIIKGE